MSSDRRLYKKPPIVEAMCQFNFAPSKEWDLTIPGVFYERIKQDFPKKRQDKVTTVEISADPSGVQPSVTPSEVACFLQGDERTLIRLGLYNLSISRLRPYTSWHHFSEVIRKAFDTFAEISGLSTIQRIGLRYINSIEVPEAQVSLEEYFEFRLHLGQSLPQEVRNFIAGAIFAWEDGKYELRLQLTNAPAGKGRGAFLLDIDCYCMEFSERFAEHALDWVNEAHRRVEEVFEGCLTNKARAMFEEGSRE